jgi:molybdenum cofactor cytidylyltransferase
MQVAAIVLAAGASRRLGRPKQLLMLGGETLLSRAIRLAGEAGALPVIAVLGAQAETIRAAIPQDKAICVVNRDWEQGIASSIHAGLDALDASEANARNVSGALVLTCDQPRLTAAHLRALLDAFVKHNAKAIVASRYAGALGVPALFPRRAFTDLRRLEGDRGARALLIHPPMDAVAVESSGGEIDIDTPDDLAHLE